MKRLAVALSLLLLPGAWAFSADRPALLVGTWNIQNLLSQNRYHAGQFRFAYPKPESAKRQLRRILLTTRPDILFLQEVGSAAHVRELQLDLAAGGLAYPFLHFSASPGARSGLAILSRRAPSEVIFHDPIPLRVEGLPESTLRRGIQEALFLHEGRALRFFHVHLKSRYTSVPEDPDSLRQRTAEMAFLVEFLQARNLADPAALPLLVGDLNTPFDDPLLAPLRQAWRALPVQDASGEEWTYFYHKSASRDRLDGFWMPRTRPPVLRGYTLLPGRLAPNAPSDHRLVLATVAGEG